MSWSEDKGSDVTSNKSVQKSCDHRWSLPRLCFSAQIWLLESKAKSVYQRSTDLQRKGEHKTKLLFFLRQGLNFSHTRLGSSSHVAIGSNSAFIVGSFSACLLSSYANCNPVEIYKAKQSRQKKNPHTLIDAKTRQTSKYYNTWKYAVCKIPLSANVQRVKETKQQ